MPAFLAWPVIKLFFGGALKKMWGIVSHASLWQIVSGVLAIFAIVQHFELSRSRAEAAKWHRQFTEEHNGRADDRKSYQQAQADAATQNKAQVAKVEQQQQKVTDDVEARYRADHARLLAERRNVQPANPAPASPPGSAGAGKASPAPSGPDSQAVPLSGPELLRAQETELQLNALIDWVIAQSKLDPNAK